MKAIASILFISLSFYSLAQLHQQEYNYTYDWEYSKANHEPIFYKPTEKVEKINFTVVNKRGKESNFIKEYNSDGNLVKYAEFEKDNNEIPILTFTYDENKLEKEARFYKRGKLKGQIQKEYNSNKKLVELVKKDKKGKIKQRDTWQYNDAECQNTSTRYKANGKVDRKWEYSYYVDCKKKQTKLFNGNGKLLKVWSHECKEEGEQLVKKKDETQVCRWEESTDNFLIKVYQSFNEKGKIRKYVQKYTLQDTTLIETKLFNENDVLLSIATYEPLERRLTSYTQFHKGKKRYESIYKYDDLKMIYSSIESRGKLQSKSVYEYKNNLLSSMKIYNKKDEIERQIKLSY